MKIELQLDVERVKYAHQFNTGDVFAIDSMTPRKVVVVEDRDTGIKQFLQIQGDHLFMLSPVHQGLRLGEFLGNVRKTRTV